MAEDADKGRRGCKRRPGHAGSFWRIRKTPYKNAEVQSAGAVQCATPIPTAALGLAYQHRPSERVEDPNCGFGPTPDGPAIARQSGPDRSRQRVGKCAERSTCNLPGRPD